MKFAYADPPYLGESSRLYGALHPEAADYDNPETHRRLIERLVDEYDGFGLSLHVPSLRTILPMVPDDARVCAWVKPFASFKPNVRQAYAWEPIIVRPLRRRDLSMTTVPDYVSANIAMERGLPGAKPASVLHWLFDFAGLTAEDEFEDMFPGTGGCLRAWESWRRQPALLIDAKPIPDEQIGAFDG